MNTRLKFGCPELDEMRRDELRLLLPLLDDSDIQKHVEGGTVIKFMHFLEKHSIQLDYFTSRQILVAGITGSGKTVTMASIMEAFLKVGINFCVFDVEGDFLSLHELNSKVIVVHKPRDDILEKLAYTSIMTNRPVIFDMTARMYEENQLTIIHYCNECITLLEQVRVPYKFFFDEAHMFFPNPQSPVSRAYYNENSPALLQTVIMVAKQGRKRGGGMVVGSQRISGLNHDIISQCEISVLHRATDQTDLKQYRFLLARLNNRKEEERIINEVPLLENGQVVVLGKQALKDRVRMRESRHAARTPTVEDYAKLETMNKDSKKLLQDADFRR